MISQGSGSLYAKILRYAYCLGFSAITWDAKNHRLKHSESRLRNSWVRFQFGLEICYQLFLAYKSWRALSDPGLEPRKKIRIQYLTALYTILNVNHFLNVLHGREFVRLMNGFDGLVKKYFPDGKNAFLFDTEITVILSVK